MKDVYSESPEHAGNIISETILLPEGYALQTLAPAAVAAVKALDARVSYVPADKSKIPGIVAEKGRFGLDPIGNGYYESLIIGGLVKTLAEESAISQPFCRGTVVSLFDQRLHYEDWQWVTDEEGGIERMYSARELNNAKTILATGSDRAGPIGNVSNLRPLVDGSYEMLSTTIDGLYAHTASAIKFRKMIDASQSAEHLFPGLLVYDYDGLVSEQQRPTEVDRSQLIKQLYITDRIVPAALLHA